jgi:hypothetical protein
VHIHNNSIASLFQQMQSMASGSSTSSSFGLQMTGQNLPASGSSQAATPLSSTPSSQFASGILSALMAAQQDQPSAQTVAGQVISAINPGGDGSLSLSQVEQSLTGGSATTSPQQASIANAFSQLDTNGDGSLSQGELANALQSLQQGDPMQGASGGRHHHHHHMQAEGTSDTAESGAASTTAASTSTTSAGANAPIGVPTAGAPA